MDWDGLDTVLTYYKPFLSHPKARLLPTGGVWLPRDRWGMRPKTKLVSMLYGTKMATEGHRIRPEIANAVRDLGVDFYGREGQPTDYGWQTKERVLADYAFTIITNTCWADNDFDEILDDCLAVGTVPIMWGFPNYAEWFNPDSIFGFDTPMAAREIVQSLSMTLYDKLRPAVEDNLNRVGKYEITDDAVAELLA